MTTKVKIARTVAALIGSAVLLVPLKGENDLPPVAMVTVKTATVPLPVIRLAEVPLPEIKLPEISTVTFVSDLWPTEYLHLFTATDYEGKLREDCEEGVLDWIAKQDLLSLPMWEGDRIFLRLLDEDTPFFSLKLTYRGDTLLEAVLNGKIIQ
jgi:hypothetical protein